MKLFADLYLDEDVDVLVAKLLRARGFGAVTTVAVGRLRASDEEQLAYAHENGLAILTHNRCDFEKLAKEWGQQGREHCGILIAVRRSPFEIAERLLRLLNELTADEFHNQLLYL